MSRALALFQEATEFGMARFQDPTALAKLREAAALWRDQGAFLTAGYVTSAAVHAAWGSGEDVDRCYKEAIEDYQHCLETDDAGLAAQLGALAKMSSELSMWSPEGLNVLQLRRAIDAEIVRRILHHTDELSWPPSCLIYGLAVVGTLDGPWSVKLPGEGLVENPPNPDEPVSQVGFGAGSEGRIGNTVWIGIASPFTCLLRASDYFAAYQLYQRSPESFQDLSLQGWPSALEGFLGLKEPAVAFETASKLFSQDVAPADHQELARRGGHWSGANIHLWTKYFAALAHLRRASSNPESAPNRIIEAANALKGTESGLVSAQVSRLRIVVRALSGLLGQSTGIQIPDARTALRLEVAIHGGQEESDRLLFAFFDRAEAAFRNLESNPASALASNELERMLQALEPLPLLGADFVSAVRPAFGEAALNAILGPQRSRIYRLLERISDEGILRRLLLRLLQSGLPRYAQVRHGPIEYGRDLCVAVMVDDRLVLRMYQVKAGDITMPVWRVASSELEQMFLAPMPDLQSGRPDRVEGILVTNGHANPFVEPLIAPWIEARRSAFGYDISFMHLDGFVEWIMTHRLVNECFAAANELGIPGDT